MEIRSNPCGSGESLLRGRSPAMGEPCTVLDPTLFYIVSALRCRILFASTELMHRPRSDFPLHIDIKNTCQIWSKTFGVRWLKLNFLQKFESSRLNPIFFGKNWVEPAQLDVFKRPKIAPKSPLRFFFQFWVEPAQPIFPGPNLCLACGQPGQPGQPGQAQLGKMKRKKAV